MTNKDAPSPNVEAALAQPDAKSQNVQEALNEALRFLDKIDHWVSAKYATLAARKICDVLEKLPALAQSDAEPKHDVRVTDAMVEAAGEAWLRARLNIGPDGLTEECWSEILSAMRVVLAVALAQSDAGLPDCPTDGVAARQGNGG